MSMELIYVWVLDELGMIRPGVLLPFALQLIGRLFMGI